MRKHEDRYEINLIPGLHLPVSMNVVDVSSCHSKTILMSILFIHKLSIPKHL